MEAFHRLFQTTEVEVSILSADSSSKTAFTITAYKVVVHIAPKITISRPVSSRMSTLWCSTKSSHKQKRWQYPQPSITFKTNLQSLAISSLARLMRPLCASHEAPRLIGVQPRIVKVVQDLHPDSDSRRSWAGLPMAREALIAVARLLSSRRRPLTQLGTISRLIRGWAAINQTTDSSMSIMLKAKDLLSR